MPIFLFVETICLAVWIALSIALSGDISFSVVLRTFPTGNTYSHSMMSSFEIPITARVIQLVYLYLAEKEFWIRLNFIVSTSLSDF